MTDVGYASPEMGKRGPKPTRGTPKAPFSTRIPVEHIAFLRSLGPGKQAGWLEALIDAHPDYLRWLRASKRGKK